MTFPLWAKKLLVVFLFRKEIPKNSMVHHSSIQRDPVRTMVEFARIHLSMRSWLLVVYQDANIPRPARCALGFFSVEIPEFEMF